MTGIYRNTTTGERVRPVPGSAEHLRVKHSQRYAEEKADPPRSEGSSDNAARPTARTDAGEPNTGSGERRTAKASGTARIKTGGEAS